MVMDEVDRIKQLMDLMELANRLIKNQMIYNDIKEVLRQNKPFSEEELIDAKIYGKDKPQRETVKTIAGVRIVITVLDRMGQNNEDIAGADFLYEISNTKFILVQMKKENQRIEHDQLIQLLRCCNYPVPNQHLESDRINGFCGSYYSIVNGKNRAYYHSACEVRRLLGDGQYIPKKKIKHGISERTFEELFAKCKIGAPLNAEIDHLLDSIVNYLLDMKHMIVIVKQSKTFEQMRNNNKF